MALASPYLSILTLSVNGLNSPIKGIEWLNGFKKQNKTRYNYKLPMRDPRRL
jgi:hypothetical protein